jgi:hypothetical protein
VYGCIPCKESFLYIYNLLGGSGVASLANKTQQLGLSLARRLFNTAYRGKIRVFAILPFATVQHAKIQAFAIVCLFAISSLLVCHFEQQDDGY